MKLTKVKSLIPAPKDGKGGITYEIVTNLSVLSADYDGHVQAHYLQPIAYATQDGVREMIHCSANGDWQIEYSIDGGVYTGCYSFNVRIGGRMFSVYGIMGSEVATIQESVRFQLVYDGDVMFQMAPIQVVRNGKRGPFYFPAGVFNPNTEYTRNDNSAPYVSVVDDTVTPNVTYYYMLIADTNLVEGVYIAPGAPDASDIWELMTSNFKYLITEAIFSAFAKLGGFIVQGNNFISQYGALLYNNSGTVTKTAIDSTNYDTLVDGRLPYTYFDGTVTDPSSGNYKFVPSLMLDALTGKGSFGGDSVRFNADGSGWLAKGNINWDPDGGLSFKGSTRSPFAEVDYQSPFFWDAAHDNYGTMLINTAESRTLPTGLEYSGRRLVIVNGYWGGYKSSNSGIGLNPATGDKLFNNTVNGNDGQETTTGIYLAHGECIELLGYGDETTFYGWIILRKIKIYT